MNGTRHYDAAIIAAWRSGKPPAMAAAGHRTAIIEQEHIGGSCVNEGCTPTKTMVASAGAAYLTRRASDRGVGIAPVSVDMEPGPQPALGGHGPWRALDRVCARAWWRFHHLGRPDLDAFRGKVLKAARSQADVTARTAALVRT